ncbi:hypothetical protein OKJ48_00755 [Streptomyces kunmingensis]|uniref:Uncharacterized protein n=1 Tax=Streptomyces kunmingensis TaxID=68225 RepID=A0ABU6C277_9ACTN|nr:hypothetical protein [Streptomyces kunmingensis]MEB3958793.1 hypothetical protein [Streptomyces kunmingensis]
MGQATYVRFEGTVRHARGHFPGIFVMANELAADGTLSDEQYRFWRSGNDWYDANYTNPTTVDPKVYDPAVHPGAVAWFKASAHHLIERVDGYRALLAAHGVECRRLESSDPGVIVYEDENQIVVVPAEVAGADGGSPSDDDAKRSSSR